MSDVSKICFAPYQMFDSFYKLKSKVDTFSIEWGLRATCYGYRINCYWFAKLPKKVENKFFHKIH